MVFDGVGRPTRLWCVVIDEAFLSHILPDVYCRGIDRIIPTVEVILGGLIVVLASRATGWIAVLLHQVPIDPALTGRHGHTMRA